MGSADVMVQPGRSKTRADKDREVAEFLNRHGITRDAKTAGTKWDNMLGEFRKDYEWERGGERESIGKIYFRLSPYERKIHRLPASFDEDVFEELAQFMGARMRIPQPSRSGGGYFSGGDETRSGAMVLAKLLPPPLFRDEEFPISGLQTCNKDSDSSQFRPVIPHRFALFSAAHKFSKSRFIFTEKVLKSQTQMTLFE